MISYIFTRIFIESFRFIPFRLMFIISDFLSFLLHSILGYRKNIVYDNLTKTFPEKSNLEITKIAKKAYKNFIDISLESLKMFTISNKEMFKRFKLINNDLIKKYYNKEQSIIGVSAHYGNWEYGISFPYHFAHHNRIIFKPLSNKYLTKYINKNRSRLGLELIALKKTKEAFKNISKPTAVFLLADQSPSSLTNAIWIEFLNRDTPCIHGPEAYSKKYNWPIVFCDIQRVKRGYYTAEFTTLIENPNEYRNGEITAIYMKKIEEIIRKKPEDWLWTHKRWKHKRENGKILKDYYYK